MSAGMDRTNQHRSTRHRRLARTLIQGLLLVLPLMLTACNSHTALRVNFNSDTVGAPPAPLQSTGSVALDLGAGSVTVVAAPTPGMSKGKWGRIHHPAASSAQTALRVDFDQLGGPGRYSLVSVLYIPRGTGMVTVALESSGQPVASFMHINFMPEGHVRIDDGPTVFGDFPHDQSFTLNVVLDIGDNSAVAQIDLLGGMALGSATVGIDPSVLPLAWQFGTVRYMMGFEHTGNFFVDDILVTRAKDVPSPLNITAAALETD